MSTDQPSEPPLSSPDSISKTMSELKKMLPTVNDSVLRGHVDAAHGDYNESLRLALDTPDSAPHAPHSIFSYFPTEASSGLPSNASLVALSTSERDALKTKYGAQLEKAKKAVGADYEDSQVLLCFEKHNGDIKNAMMELLANTSRSLERSQLLSSRDMLRSSLKKSNPDMKGSTGIDELPLNLNMSILESTEDLKIPTKLPPLFHPEDLSSDDEEELPPVAEKPAASQAPISAATISSSPAKTGGSTAPKTVSTPIINHPAPIIHNPAPTPVEPVKPKVVRVVEKSALGEVKHDEDALREFMEYRGVANKTNTLFEEARKISFDDFVVIGAVLKSVKDLHAARKRTLEQQALNEASTKKPAKETSKFASVGKKFHPVNARARAAKEVESVAITNTAQVSEVPDLRPAPLSRLDLTDFIQAQVDSGADIASTLEMCASAQEDEIRQLEAILTQDRIQISDSNPKVVSVSLHEPAFEFSKSYEDVSLLSYEARSTVVTERVTFANPLNLQLILIVPPLYPECAPILTVRSIARSCPLSTSIFERMEAYLSETVMPGFPCLFSLVQTADEFLTTDEEIRDIAIKKQAENQAARFNPYSSLKLLFTFQTATFHRFEDILTQRSKVVARATQFILNGPSASGLEPPLQTTKGGDFPVLNLMGNVDSAPSLRLLGLTPAAVRILVQSYNWELQPFSAAYLASLSNGTFAQFVNSKGVVLLTEDQINTPASFASDLLEEVECATCFCDVPRHQLFSLSCGHYQCISCYCEFADVNASNNGLETWSCPQPGCKMLVDPVSVMALLSAKRWASYCSGLVSHFVSTNSGYAWCPSEFGCDYVAEIGTTSDPCATTVESSSAPQSKNPTMLRIHSHNAPSLVQCPCSATYCSLCRRKGGHYPATCSEMNEWFRILPDDMGGTSAHEEELTQKAIKSISRSCPRCGSAISKSGGCPHMTCRLCAHEFCWACFADWSSRHYACDQSEIAITDEATYANFTVHPILSLLSKHRNASYDACAMAMKDQVTEALCRSEPESKRTFGAPSVQATLGALITFADTEAIINAWELLHVAHYLVTHATKSCYANTIMRISTNHANIRLSSSINRVIQDMIFLSNIFKSSTYRKEITFHIGAAVNGLKISLKLLLEHFNALRMNPRRPSST